MTLIQLIITRYLTLSIKKENKEEKKHLEGYSWKNKWSVLMHNLPHNVQMCKERKVYLKHCQLEEIMKENMYLSICSMKC